MKIDETLLRWYDAHARVLAFRGTRDPYRVWLSEIMLQQTRSETVERYYARFLERFPDVFALAAADQDEVLKCWEGLGYYSRARNLHAAAKRVAADGGRFPDSVEGLLALPGVGPYAARAIASIAFDRCAPALDGNQLRVLSRLLAVPRVLNTPFDLLTEAEALISRTRPGDYNQALMDLGASICTPRRPSCDICPLCADCLARAEDDPERYPLRPAPVQKREEAWTITLVQIGDRLCARRRPEKGLLGGLYEFIALEGQLSPEAAARALAAQGFENPLPLRELPASRHVFTHLIWHMRGLHLTAEVAPPGVLLLDADALEAHAFPSALRVYREAAQALLDTEAAP